MHSLKADTYSARTEKCVLSPSAARKEWRHFLLAALVLEFSQLVLDTSSGSENYCVIGQFEVGVVNALFKFVQEWVVLRTSQEFCTWVSREVWNVLARTNFVLVRATSRKRTNFSVVAEYVSAFTSRSVPTLSPWVCVCDGWFNLCALISQCTTGVKRHPASSLTGARWGCLNQSTRTHARTRTAEMWVPDTNAAVSRVEIQQQTEPPHNLHSLHYLL